MAENNSDTKRYIDWQLLFFKYFNRSMILNEDNFSRDNS